MLICNYALTSAFSDVVTATRDVTDVELLRVYVWLVTDRLFLVTGVL